MTTERREHKRTFFIQSPDRKLYLYIDDQHIEVESVWDISPFGIGLQIENAINIDHAVTTDADIQLRYQYAGVDQQVRGSITWSKIFIDGPDSLHRSYRLGVCLDDDDIEPNVLFFKFMTGELDDLPAPLRTKQAG
ncbi:MAG: hypothetical protein V3S33_05680 [Gammaproteobacteria bacterium]